MDNDTKNIAGSEEEIINCSDYANVEEKSKDTFGNMCRSFFKTIWRWIKRLFWGPSKEEADILNVEAIDSPAKQLVKNFFSNKLALSSFIFLVFIFCFVFFGSLAMPIDLSSHESVLVNIAPSSTLMKVPGRMKNDVKSISSFSFFSVGLNNKNQLYVWGNTKIPNSASKADIKNFPDELAGKEVAFAAAGLNHAIAITADGHVVGWGEFNNGQYGDNGSMTSNPMYVMKMSDALPDGTIDVNNVKQLTCGRYVSAIVMNDGSAFCWGGYKNGARNMKEINNWGKKHMVDKVVFSGYSAVILLKDGKVVFDEAKFDNISVKRDGKTEIVSIKNDIIKDNKIKDIAATNGTIAFVLENGELIVAGDLFDVKENNVPIPDFKGEKIVQIGGGSKHYTVLTDKNKVYSFGNSTYNQCKIKKCKIKEDSKLYVCSYQTYVVNDDKVAGKWGFKGAPMGTDDLGRDVFIRVINGGKMTMTVGGVAVIISSIIGIIIGCLSGYFGGRVDMFLMRLTEVFSAIPFLPFALILSAILTGSNLHENVRIFMIMVVLGLLSWTGLAQMVRAQVLAEREKEFVIAAKAMGVREGKIAFKHILPNIISIILVHMTLNFAGCMLTEAELSYLGFGVRLPRPTWGNMLNGCNDAIVIGQFWWRWLFPAIFLLLTTISINIIGDTLRDILDPKTADR